MRSGLPFSLPAAALLIAAAAGIGSAQYVEDSIDVGGTGVSALAYNSRADVVYARHRGASTFCAISCSLNQVVAQLALPSPSLICYNSTDNKAYVTSWGDSVLVIDGSTHARRRGIPLRWTDYPLWDSAGDRLYVTLADDNEVAVIDCRTDSVTALIRVGAWPNRLHLNTLHRKLYVQNYDDCSVSIVDLTTNQVIRTIPLGSEPQAGWYSPTADKYYCAAGWQVAVLSGERDSLLRYINLPGGGDAMAVAGVEPRGLVMVAAYWGATDSVFTIDTGSDTVVARVLVTRGPRCLVPSPASGLVYCAGDEVSVLAGEGNRVITTLRVGWGPLSQVVVHEWRRVYVGHSNTRMVYVVRDSVTGVAEGGPGVAAARATRTLAGHSLRHAGPGEALLVDISGRRVAALVPGFNDLRHLSPGVYFVRMATGEGRTATRKVVLAE